MKPYYFTKSLKIQQVIPLPNASTIFQNISGKVAKNIYNAGCGISIIQINVHE
jgi:hypothetical protein